VPILKLTIIKLLLTITRTPGKIGKNSFRNLSQAIAVQLGSMLELNSRCQLHLARFFGTMVAENLVHIKTIRFLDFNKLHDNENGLTGKLGIFLNQLLLQMIQRRCLRSRDDDNNTGENGNFMESVAELSSLPDVRESMIVILRGITLPQLRSGPSPMGIDLAERILAALTRELTDTT